MKKIGKIMVCILVTAAFLLPVSAVNNEIKKRNKKYHQH